MEASVQHVALRFYFKLPFLFLLQCFLQVVTSIKMLCWQPQEIQLSTLEPCSPPYPEFLFGFLVRRQAGHRKFRALICALLSASTLAQEKSHQFEHTSHCIICSLSAASQFIQLPTYIAWDRCHENKCHFCLRSLGGVQSFNGVDKEYWNVMIPSMIERCWNCSSHWKS